jgi:CRP-like cAMP-binding protein
MKLSADKLEILRGKVLLFDGFSGNEILMLLEHAKKRVLTDGDIIVEEGQIASSMSILIGGQASVQRTHRGGPETIAILEPGTTIGEMAMLDAAPRSARVIAKGDGVLLEIDPSLINLVDSHILQKLYRNLSIILVRRLRATNRRMESIAARTDHQVLDLDRLREIDLGGVDLSGVRAKRINLSSADLHTADLRDADLRGADLRGARLEGAKLTDPTNDPISRLDVAPPSADEENLAASSEHHWDRLMKSLAQRAKGGRPKEP